LPELQWIIVNDGVATTGERNRVTSARRLPSLEIGKMQSSRLVLLVVIPTVPDMLLDDAGSVLARVTSALSRIDPPLLSRSDPPLR
jgi:hypothetical protein